MSSQRSTPARTSFHPIATDDQYRFRPLSTETTIRLIKIWPEKINGHIACTIKHVHEKPQEIIKYHALSYVWGNSKDIKHIYLGDQGDKWYQFELHENLWLFLDHAWQHRMFDQYFWTDYLCIDQSAHGEKSQQVQQMHTIYRNAALVIIWLQLTEKEDSGLLEYIDLTDRYYAQKMDVLSWIERLEDQDLHQIPQAVKTNPYWTRIWIVQEVVVAKEVCVITKRVTINLHKLHFLLGDSWGYWDRKKPSVGELCKMRATGGKIPLWRILKDFEDYECKFEVDRIYGILGLAENNEDGSSPATNIQVDYKKSLPRVMLDVLFESFPPLNHLKDTVFANPTREGVPPLCPGVFTWFVMKDYIKDIKTTERQRDYARIALEAFEEFDTILAATGTPLPDASELLANLFSSAAETGWKTTRHQNAALLGMMLSARRSTLMEEVLYCFEERRLCGFSRSASSWRCAAHGFRNAGYTGLGSYETVAIVATSPGTWSRPGIVAACGKQSQDCDGSVMTCELSHIGLRIQVEPAINSGNEGHLSIHRMKLGDFNLRVERHT